MCICYFSCIFFFFFNDTATPEIYTYLHTLSLHDALPIELRWQIWPVDNLPETYLTEEETKPEDLYGAVVRRGFTAGEPIVSRRVILPGDRGFLAAVLRPGFRPIAIRANDPSGVSGLVFPGDRIHLLLPHSTTDRTRTDPIRPRASETIPTRKNAQKGKK